MIAIITEKPSVGIDIARVVGATRKHAGYMEGNGYLVTWAFGHLIQLAPTSFYGHSRPGRDSLPVIPEPFGYVIRQHKGEKGIVTDPAAARQLSTIGKVLSRASSVIAATDAGREGELIFRYIRAHADCKLPVKRLWISSLTDEAIRAGMENLREGVEFDNLYLAADCRAKADWLIGINASQALAAASGLYNNSLGRVQTPTLALISSRYKENRLFVPTDYWELYAVLRKGDAIRKFRYDGELTDKEQGEDMQRRIIEGGTMRITRSERKPLRQSPPLLYDLTALQKDANVRHDMSPEQTLNEAQSLYERKLITYPRTGSRHIPQDVFRTVPELLKKALAMPSFGRHSGLIDFGDLPRTSVDDNKVTDHHALLITGIRPTDLTEPQQQVYDLIATRMLESFAPDCQKETLVMEAEAEGAHFISRSTATLVSGWRSIAGTEEEKEDGNVEGEGEALFAEGETAEIGGASLSTKKTKPRPLYTEASLLTAMENAGREVADDDARAAMKECGLGTPATRAGIISTLFRRDYIKRSGKSLIPTEKGLFVYEAVKDMRIADPQLTGEWEKAFAEIGAGNMAADTFLEAIKIYTRQVTAEILSLTFLNSSPGTFPCPKCGKGRVMLRAKVAKCDDKECGFLLFRRFLNKELTDQHLEQLLSSGKTKPIKGLKGKSGTPFDARLTFDDSFCLTFAKDKKAAKQSPKGAAPRRTATAKPKP